MDCIRMMLRFKRDSCPRSVVAAIMAFNIEMLASIQLDAGLCRADMQFSAADSTVEDCSAAEAVTL